ncbi:hypothetical protein FV232_19805 [Methylobacterium sp. WL30]|uniref:hypothetical protein n=1 Tax=unclassified Methylobacterium TaxID=2615210 RepID=UPI0011CBAC3A|nr:MULTISPECIES: hypothetical protein [unclassified Methylobacterium]TXN41408.1 hypothetical protein FV225_02660 [Methylobacterium sp. WL93]TXN49790.1 hypothetical protein FV227_14950 [Methylobacterium sp. WL119]TXN64871.1 hypothetical protein FV232_19805 [Methylobacterium sp. WL30]
MSEDTAAVIQALATENAEQRAALAEAQELLIEAAIDAGEMHTEIEALRAQGAALQADRAAQCLFGNKLCDLTFREEVINQTW